MWTRAVGNGVGLGDGGQSHTPMERRFTEPVKFLFLAKMGLLGSHTSTCGPVGMLSWGHVHTKFSWPVLRANLLGVFFWLSEDLLYSILANFRFNLNRKQNLLIQKPRLQTCLPTPKIFRLSYGPVELERRDENEWEEVVTKCKLTVSYH